MSTAVHALIQDLGPFVDDGDVGVVADIDGNPSGFGSIVIRPGPSAVDLYWKGPVPAKVTDIIEAHPDVAVTVRTADWSLAELVAARGTAFDLLASKKFRAIDFQSAGPQPDASGLLIQLGDVTEAQARKVKSATEKATGVTVFVETGVHWVPADTM